MKGVLHAMLDELRDDPAAVAELRTLLAVGPAVYTPRTLAAELELTPRAVRAAIERGDLQATRSGRGYVIGAEAVAEWAAPRARASSRRAKAHVPKRRPMSTALDESRDV